MIVSIDGYDINYKITGDGDKYVVILQGWGTTCGIYDSIASALAPKYKVVQFDFPGFGESTEPREPWNVDAYTDFFIKFMEALKVDSATLIGHSYGGRVIIKLVNRKALPFEIERIVFVDAAGIVPEKSFSQKMKIRRYKLLKKLYFNKIFYALFPELVDDWKSRQGSADYRNATPVMRQCLVMAVNEDLRHLMPNIKQDTLLIWGDKDTATPLSDGKLFEELIPSAGLVVLEGGHYSFLDQPAKFKSVIQSYFGV